MRECPACNENFPDDYRFCELDGTPLKRKRDGSSRFDPSKFWSVVGVGLLLGALVISAASIVFHPRPSAPPAGGSTTPTVDTKALSEGPSDTGLAVGDAAPSEAAPPQALAAVPADGRPPKEQATETTSAPAPNPKAAALAVEQDAQPKIEEQLPTPSRTEAAGDTARQVKSAAEPQPGVKRPVSGTAPTNGTQSTTAEAKKDQRGRTPKEISSAKTSEKQKSDKEKKGGFLRVFKRIFGQ